ncbi:hypothetical protein [Actinomadura bangladeshensis]|uniref:Uncharacterized protein n=1 Tax=Actinomadura bangladeshensis TaxID=453573 RepID=A0A6L9Q9C8_9ACTN|nr:hypothetical protein [Actinomadura bangladeshensis]NEA20904.1 hypothetical protein [Actinomadura bangladeshensis]
MDRQSPSGAIRRLVTGVAIVIAVILAIGGLAAIGALVLAVIAASNYGSNK